MDTLSMEYDLIMCFEEAPYRMFKCQAELAPAVQTSLLDSAACLFGHHLSTD